ncbi:MAG: hypothetical protein JRJ87_08170, partial [Deltaproteobacteria bacterium]|nr:hypothetical protein [Deltaproteobacteria bacterium]
MLEGPRGTLVLGYANGQVGIWDLENGARLEIAKLHGPLTHLRIHQQKLYAVTELGDYLVWDLSIFRADYCSLVRSLWDKVPVVWQAGRPTLLPRPEEHRCRTSQLHASKVSDR